MKRQLLLKAILTSFLIAFNSCSDDGVDGTNGVDGKDGVDATGSNYIVLSGNITDDEAKITLETEFSENTQVILVANTTKLTTVDLTGISRLVDLKIRNNEKLVNIVAPDLEEVVNEFEINNNLSISNLNLPNLKRLNNIVIIENVNLESIHLDALTDVYDFAEFYQNYSLQTLSLSKLTGTSKTNLSIGSNWEITTLNLSNLKNLKNLSISATALVSIEIPEIISINRAYFSQNSFLKLVSFPKLEKIRTNNFVGFSLYNSSSFLEVVSLPVLNSVEIFEISSYNAPTTSGSLILSSLIDFDRIDVSFFSLQTADIDALLSHLVSITPAITDKYISLYGYPSIQGDTDASALRSNGNMVNFN